MNVEASFINTDEIVCPLQHIFTGRHGSTNGHGTAQDSPSRMVESVRDITNPLRSQSRRIYVPTVWGSDYVGVSEAAGF